MVVQLFGKQRKGKTTSSFHAFFSTKQALVPKGNISNQINPCNKLCLTLSPPPSPRVQLCLTILCCVLSTAPVPCNFIHGPHRWSNGQHSQVQVAKSKVFHLLCAKATEHPNAGRPFQSTKILRWAALNRRYEMDSNGMHIWIYNV